MFDLPDVPPYRLLRAPLAQALAQVRYPIQARLGTMDGLARVQELLGSDYPFLEPAAAADGGIEVQFGPAGAQAAVTHQNQLVFKSEDGHSIWVTPDSTTLSVGDAYKGARDFGQRFEKVLNVLTRIGVSRCDRIAARYLSVAPTPPNDNDAWTRWFNTELIGWQGHGHLRGDVKLASTITQSELTASPSGTLADFPASVGALIRHGLVPSGSTVNGIPAVQVHSPSFVLDFDFFCAAPQPWRAQRLNLQFIALHGQIDKFFKWTLQDAGLDYFGYEEVVE